MNIWLHKKNVKFYFVDALSHTRNRILIDCYIETLRIRAVGTKKLTNSQHSQKLNGFVICCLYSIFLIKMYQKNMRIVSRKIQISNRAFERPLVYDPCIQF